MLNGDKEKIMDKSFLHRAIPIVLSVWILTLTVYYCADAYLCYSDKFHQTPSLMNTAPHSPDADFAGQLGVKQLIAETLKFHWVPEFLSRFHYVFYALLLNFIAMLTGNRILRWLKVGLDSNISKIVFSVPLGWGMYSTVIFYLGISGLLYKDAVYCFLTFLGILSILEIKRFVSEWKALSASSRFKIDKSDLVFLPVIIIFLAVQFVTSFSPVWAIDTLNYHLALPKLYIKHHAIIHIPGFWYSTLPAHTNMLYLLGLLTSGETLSKLFSFSISSVFLISIFSIGKRYFSKEVGYLAVVIMMLSVPFFIRFFTEPYVDAALGLFSLLGVYSFVIWIEGLSLRQAQGKLSNEVKERKEGYLYLSVICCACAAATKIQGLFFVLMFFAGFLVTFKRVVSEANLLDKQFLRKLVWCILVVSITALPWYIRSWWLTGDPFFPVLYNHLGGRYWNEYAMALFSESMRAQEYGGLRDFSDFIRINKNLFVINRDKFLLGNGMCFLLSPIITVFLIPALITQRNWNRLIRYLFFITLVYYVFFIFTSPQIRFFYVGIAILGIIVAHHIKTMWTKYSLTRIPIILCIVILSITYSSVYLGKLLIEGHIFTGLGILSRKQFLNGNSYMRCVGEFYSVATWVNENLPQDSKILFWGVEGYYLDRDYVRVLILSMGVLNPGTINNTPAFLKSIKELGITHLLYNATFDCNKKESLDRYVSALFEGGKIIPIKQINNYTIYSVLTP